MVARILRIFSYLYHLVLSLFLLGLALIAMSGSQKLTMPFLPWKGDSLETSLLIGGILGILSIALAVTGFFRFLFPLWALMALVFLVRGFFLQPYQFADQAEFTRILWITGGALLAFLFSLTLFGRKTKRA